MATVRIVEVIDTSTIAPYVHEAHLTGTSRRHANIAHTIKTSAGTSELATRQPASSGCMMPSAIPNRKKMVPVTVAAIGNSLSTVAVINAR
jgi:hypothetical protein